MEFNKPMEVSSFDWDDSQLIIAYDLSMKERLKNKAKKSKSKNSKAKKEYAKEQKSGKHWKVGDYCRAMYSEDGLLYEAMILDIQDDVCSVEFLGYGDIGESLLDCLEDSLGKKARQKQRKSVKKQEIGTCTSDTDYSYMNEVKDVNKTPKTVHHPNGHTPTVEQHDHFPSSGYAQHSQQANQQHSQQANQQHSNAFPFTFNPNTSHRPAQGMGGPAHCLPPPPPQPPMPPCSAVANDPALSAMLVAWYMAGYYTGLHQNQKSSHCRKSCCCDHQVPKHCNHLC